MSMVEGTLIERLSDPFSMKWDGGQKQLVADCREAAAELTRLQGALWPLVLTWDANDCEGFLRAMVAARAIVDRRKGRARASRCGTERRGAAERMLRK